VVPTPYETRVWFAASVPVVVICVLLGGYLLPKYVSSGIRYSWGAVGGKNHGRSLKNNSGMFSKSIAHFSPHTQPLFSESRIGGAFLTLTQEEECEQACLQHPPSDYSLP
jgi:hypothetical protein